MSGAPSIDLAAAKDRVRESIRSRSELLIDVSHDIHAHPELCFEEHHAHDRLTAVLADEGLDVERGAYGLDTAFVARAGVAGPTVAVICEYDALPEIGHACGHNIIAAAGLGAGLAAAELAEAAGGRVVILGTPAEEGGGGKVRMAERGAFDGIDAALMVHPAGADLVSMSTLAIHQVRVRYHGRAAHAAAAPHKGVNALDAAVLGYVNVAALRQHIRPDERIHGIFTEAGEKPNIVPRTAAAHWYVRSPRFDLLESLKARVIGCLEAGASAAGCEMEHEWIDPAYADMVDNGPLSALYASNAASIGRPPAEPSPDNRVVGSTDMGNVSHLVPSIHPMVKVAPADVAIHTAEFERHAGSESGDAGVLDGATAMAMTVADLWLQPDALDAVRETFRAGSADGALAGSAPPS